MGYSQEQDANLATTCRQLDRDAIRDRMHAYAAAGFVERATAVQQRIRLERVGLRAGGRIDQIRLTYRFGATALGAAEQRQELHGQAGGSDLGESSSERTWASSGSRPRPVRGWIA
jgi:hypothetical protein